MKTSEMIAMLEKNPRLKFTLKGFSYKVGFNNRDEISGVNEKGDYMGSVTFTKNDDWQLVREPVPVWEAIKALTEGKKVGLKGPHNAHIRKHNVKDLGCIYIEQILGCEWYILDEQEG